jgi:DNA-binding NarL/FixJ family response regulator
LLEHEEGLELVGVVDDLAALLDALTHHQTDVVVLDLRVAGGALTDAIGDVRRRAPTTELVIVTLHVERSFAASILEAGALGVVLKDSAERALGDAVRSAASGERYAGPTLE